MTKLWIYWINNEYDFASSLLYSLYFKISLMFLSTLKYIVFTNLKMCFVCLTVFGIHYSMFFMISLYWPGLCIWLCWDMLSLWVLWHLYAVYAFSILTWSLHLTGLVYTLSMFSMISLYWPGLYTWLCWGTLWLCALWYLYTVYALSIRLYTDLVSTLDCIGVRCDYVLCDIFMLSMLCL